MDELPIIKIKLEIKNKKENTYKHIEHLKDNMSEKSKRLLQLSIEKGVSNWFTVLPIAEHGFELSKQQFWDSTGLRYGWEISKLPTCPCGSKFDTQHSMGCNYQPVHVEANLIHNSMGCNYQPVHVEANLRHNIVWVAITNLSIWKQI